ncbi:hypothetical protein [Limnofasciculus baicalensis]|uniref:Uncharacterized protein n=1 Tax=Limnofasciculus baicalensis BBK-W-15 TaxID=2699891 RepID=A0AAE3KNI4_9CYAN|nr:hypothetical protein [Limnofasciculus baicalensis]MCP2729871.1 hypothetical protein [Limnofasciculus baicalensis BBK-W-15]
MPQINISLSDEIHDYLVQIANLTGITKSSLAAEYVRRGLYEDARNHKELVQLQRETRQPVQINSPTGVTPTSVTATPITPTADTPTATPTPTPITPTTDTPTVKMPTDKRKPK